MDTWEFNESLRLKVCAAAEFNDFGFDISTKTAGYYMYPQSDSEKVRAWVERPMTIQAIDDMNPSLPGVVIPGLAVTSIPPSSRAEAL